MGSLQKGKGSACVKDVDFGDCATRNYEISVKKRIFRGSKESFISLAPENSSF